MKRDLDSLFNTAPDIDTLILGCTHYPLLLNKIKKYAPEGVRILPQGDIVADSLLDYLKRHREIDCRITRSASTEYITTEEPDKFASLAAIFMGSPIKAHRVQSLGEV